MTSPIKTRPRTPEEINNPPFYDSLELSFSNSCTLITQAVKQARAPMHIGCLGYVDTENRLCQRNVVLRHAKEDLTEIGFHTDYRSGKIKALSANPACSMMFYDPFLKVQLVIQGVAKIHYQDEIAEASWQKTPVMARRCYLIAETPGAVTTQPTAGFDEKFTMNEQSLEETEIGYRHFCVIRIKIHHLDRTFLSFTGNRRSVYEISADQPPKAQWLIP